jgi:hypothetical protein
MKTTDKMQPIKRLLLPFIILLMAAGCSKESDEAAKVPSLSTITVTEISSTAAVSGGNITSDGGSTITARGICWSTNQNPTLTDNIASDGSTGIGNFTCNIFGLTGNSTYYVRAYATNSAGTSYGDQKQFTASAISENATTMQASGVTSGTATLNGLVNANYLSTEVYFEYGTTTSYGQEVMASESPVNGNSNLSVSAQIAGLIPQMLYQFRLRITNSSGTAYGESLSFKAMYVVGETGLGGIVFYVDSTLNHGLVCTLSNQGIAQWGCPDTEIVGADGTAIGTGNQNTINIMNACSGNEIAASLCADLEMNGYSDWFLPSVDELALMSAFVDDPSGGYYWSSSEKSSTQAWCGPWGGFFNSYGKTNYYKVRAVRAY